MAIVRYFFKRPYDGTLFDRLHALPPFEQSPVIQRRVVAVPDSEASYAEAVRPTKRQRVLKSLFTTPKRLNHTASGMVTPPTRRSTRNRPPTKEVLPAKEVVVTKKEAVVTAQRKERREHIEASVQRDIAEAFSESVPSSQAPSSSKKAITYHGEKNKGGRSIS